MEPSGLIPLVLGELEDDKVLVAWEVPLTAVLLPIPLLLVELGQ